MFFYFNRSFVWSKNKIKEHVIMQMLSFLMTLNSKHKTEQLKTKETKTPNTKHTKRRKRILTEE